MAGRPSLVRQLTPTTVSDGVSLGQALQGAAEAPGAVADAFMRVASNNAPPPIPSAAGNSVDAPPPPPPPAPGLFRQSTANFHPSYTDEQLQLKRDASAEMVDVDAEESKAVEDDAAQPRAAPVSAAAAAANRAAIAAAKKRYSFQIGGVTHPGGSTKPNQDTFFIWRSKESHTFVLGVLDGHGRELGTLASFAARESMEAQLTTAESDQGNAFLTQLREQPEETMVSMFAKAHEAVRVKFTEHYESQGWTVKDEDGILLKRKRNAWSCVHGGTTATVCVLLDGHKLVVANVGDSDAVLAGAHFTKRPANYFCSYSPRQAAIPAASAPPLEAQELNACHSPESPAEYKRMRTFRPSQVDATKTEIRFVYDSLSYSKANCADIFLCEGKSFGEPKVTGRGNYYKNVRNEWASLVCTPKHARFQDALAFTRSLGDFHLQSYGVSRVPEVCAYDLLELPKDQSFALTIATDGVWDNWKLDDYNREMLAEHNTSLLRGVADSQAVSEKFMKRNLQIAEGNFGSQADNMTIITCYVSPRA